MASVGVGVGRMLAKVVVGVVPLGDQRLLGVRTPPRDGGRRWIGTMGGREGVAGGRNGRVSGSSVVSVFWIFGFRAQVALGGESGGSGDAGEKGGGQPWQPCQGGVSSFSPQRLSGDVICRDMTEGSQRRDAEKGV